MRVAINKGCGPHFALQEVSQVFREPLLYLFYCVALCSILLPDIVSDEY
uniref:Uncharacterized protein n=1 Tax=Lepeophtheirus salmonis TaxID=72036 RepID=A0A0K2V131_LEPSM